MPTPSQLPEELRPLATLQAIALRDDTWHEDVDRLVVALGGGTTGAADARRPAEPGAARSKRLLAVGIAVVVVVAAVLGGWLAHAR